MQEKIDKLVKAAKNYKNADKQLEIDCGDQLDPIGCTVYAYKQGNHPGLPRSASDAAKYLRKVTELHSELVKEFGMDTDDVRAIWFPILNS